MIEGAIFCNQCGTKIFVSTESKPEEAIYTESSSTAPVEGLKLHKAELSETAEPVDTTTKPTIPTISSPATISTSSGFKVTPKTVKIVFFAGIVIFAIFIISNLFNSPTGTSSTTAIEESSNDGNGMIPHTSARHGDFDQTIRFDNLEIFAPHYYAIGRHTAVDAHNDQLMLFINVTNAGNNPHTLNQFDVSIFSPNGSEISPITGIFNNNVFQRPADARGNILPGSSQELVIVIPFIGAGDYVVHFQNFSGSANLTLPTSRDGSAYAGGLIGRWELDTHASSGHYSYARHHFLEFFENGRGRMPLNDSIMEFEWHIILGMEDNRPRLLINPLDFPETLLRSEHTIFSDELHLTNNIVITFIIFGPTNYGTDVFIRN